MKEILFLIAFLCAMKTNAQNYLITFEGTGASTSVNTVKVENLKVGTSLTLRGSDVLRLTITTGVNSVENEQSSELKIYPNPMTENSMLEVYPPVAGDAIISMFDMAGKMVTQIQCFLENNLQAFRLSGMNKGLYLINIKGKTYQYSGKLLCIRKADGRINIEKIDNHKSADIKTENKVSKGILVNVDMNYAIGDRLKFTRISGNYSTVKTDIPSSDKTIAFNFIACTDGSNNNYSVVEIGRQIWMAENLKTTMYQNSDLIETTVPVTLDILDFVNAGSSKYQWAYEEDESNVDTYGRLYTWHAATDSRNVCPYGWHTPTDAEFRTLSAFLGVAEGGKMKESGNIHWYSTNTGATNESGFTARPSGLRLRNGLWMGLHFEGNFWSSTLDKDINRAMSWNITLDNNNFHPEPDHWRSVLSVRCLRN